MVADPLSSANQDIYGPAAATAAQTYGIPQEIFSALVNQESSWDPYALSDTGRIGLTQLAPATATDMGVNPWDPVDNLNGGAKYLSDLFARYGNWSQALGAYYAGPNQTDPAIIAAGQAYSNSVLGAASQAGYNPTGATTGSSSAPQTGFDPKTMTWNGKPISTWDQILSSFGIGGSTTGPATGQSFWQWAASGPILYAGAGLILAFVAWYAIGALFKQEQPINVTVKAPSPGEVVRHAA